MPESKQRHCMQHTRESSDGVLKSWTEHSQRNPAMAMWEAKAILQWEFDMSPISFWCDRKDVIVSAQWAQPRDLGVGVSQDTYRRTLLKSRDKRAAAVNT